MKNKLKSLLALVLVAFTSITWADSTDITEVIAINFGSDKQALDTAAEGDLGFVTADGMLGAQVPLAKWNNVSGPSGTEVNVAGAKTETSYLLTYSSPNTWNSQDGNTYDTSIGNLTKGYLDVSNAGGSVPEISLSGMPTTGYDVAVILSGDGGTFGAVTVNGKDYIGSDGKTILGEGSWGTRQSYDTLAEGQNVIFVKEQSAESLTIVGNRTTNSARASIAGLMVFFREIPDAQVIDWTAQPAEQLKTSALPELTTVSVQLKLADGATLEMDSDITGHMIEIVGNNVTVNITNWDIEKSAVESVVSGATVTTAYTDTIGVEIDGVTYNYFFRGTTDANYGTVANWYTGKRVMGDQTKWFSVSGDVAPGVGGNMWHHMLLDGDMMDPANVTVGEDGYKTISATVLEGWNLGYFVRNGVHLNVATLNKIQNGGGFTAVWRVDDTSKITIGARGNSSHNNLANYYIDNEEGIVFTEFDIADANYYFDEDGSVKLDGVSGTQTIKAITLDLGTVAEGRKVVSRKVIGFNSSTATYTVEEGAVTTTAENVTPEAVDILQNVGQYKFEKKDDGYYVSYVAYAETDEIGAMNTWTKGEDALWSTVGNWSSGSVPAEGATVAISITADTTITIPEGGVTVDMLVVNGEGTLTIVGGKLTATKIFANANIAAGEDTLALAEMDIAEGKTVTYTTTTTAADPDNVGNSHALTLKAMTGAGTFVKKGTGIIGLFATAAEPAIVVEEGAIYVRDAPTTAMNIAAKAGAEIRLAAWHVNFANTANKITLDGGAQLTLANGANVSGTITIANAAETAAKICGSSFNDSTIAAAITGAGKVEFADGGSFGDATKYPCDGATTYSGVISGDLQVIISDTSAVTFTANNTYTGGTVIAEGATVSVSNLNTIFGTGNVTGAGTVKIAGGTYNGLSLAQYTDANTIIEIPADSTVTGYFNNATWTCAAKIRLNGTLSLTNGFGAGRYTFTGPWTGAGAISLSHTSPADVVRITGDISGFTGNLSVTGARALTFCAATTGNNQKYAGKICVHGDYAYTAKVNGTWSAPVVVENGAKIGGEGSIDNTLTFNAGSIIDGAVTATGDVTLNGTVTVSGEAGATVLTCANAASLDLTKFAAPAGLKCVAEDGAVKLAVATVTVTLPAAPENMVWFYDGQPVENNAVTVNSGTSVTVTLKPAVDYIFSDNTTEKTFDLGEVTGDITGEIDIEDIVAVKPEVKIGEKSYATFASALAAAADGDTIVLEKDVICTEKPVFNNGGVVNVDVRDYVFVSTEQARVRNVASADGAVPSNNIKFVSGFGWEVYQYNDMPATNVEFRVFPTLEAAVTYNPSTNNPARIYPYQNVTQEADVTLKAYPAGTSSTICIDPEYDITWDLNGYTVLQESPTGNPLEAIIRGKFTLKDSSAEQTGKWIAGACGVTDPGNKDWYGSGGPAFYLLGEGELVLEGGTISIARNETLDNAGNEIVNSGGLIRVDGGKLDVNGATLQVDDTYGIMAWGGEIEINAGTFDIDPEISAPVSVYASGYYEDVAVEVNSTFDGALCVVAGYKGASAMVNVAGVEYATGDGWLVPSVGEGLMAFDGLVLEKGVAVVKSATSVNTYATLADAVAAAQAGDTITLMADTTENITVPAGFTGTIDLGGNTLTGNVKAAYSEATTTDFILQNGYIITPAGNTDKGAIFIKYAAVELIDIDLTANYHGIRTEVGGNVTINGGRYEAICKPDTQYNVVYAKEDSTITIEDGTFIRTPNGGTVYCINPNATASEIYVNGGSFTTIGSVYLVDLTAKGTCAISGGLFSVAAKNDVNQKLASGYGIEDVVDTDYFTVVEKPAIEPSGSIEVSAADAAAAANKVEILIPEGVTGVDAATYATYFTKNAEAVEGTTDKWTVTAALNPEVVTPKITAISFDENGVTITLENKLPGLYYAVRSAATVDKVDTDEATVTTELNAPATGDAAFYRVLVDFAPIVASQPTPAE